MQAVRIIDRHSDLVQLDFGSSGHEGFAGTGVINTFSQQQQFAVGSVGTPSISFSGDTDTGFYSPGADQIGIATAGTARGTFSSVFTYRGNTGTSLIRAEGGTNLIGESSYFMAQGRVRWGYDGSLQAGVLDDNAVTRPILARSGGLEGWRIHATGGAAQIGFLGAAPVSRQSVTGSRAGNAALASLCTALANLGLITNSTTA